jgi:hypothetical protein
MGWEEARNILGRPQLGAGPVHTARCRACAHSQRSGRYPKVRNTPPLAGRIGLVGGCAQARGRPRSVHARSLNPLWAAKLVEIDGAPSRWLGMKQDSQLIVVARGGGAVLLSPSGCHNPQPLPLSHPRCHLAAAVNPFGPRVKFKYGSNEQVLFCQLAAVLTAPCHQT